MPRPRGPKPPGGSLQPRSGARGRKTGAAPDKRQTAARGSGSRTSAASKAAPERRGHQEASESSSPDRSPRKPAGWARAKPKSKPSGRKPAERFRAKAEADGETDTRAKSRGRTGSGNRSLATSRAAPSIAKGSRERPGQTTPRSTATPQTRSSRDDAARKDEGAKPQRRHPSNRQRPESQAETAPHIDRKRGSQAAKQRTPRVAAAADPNAIGAPMRIAKAMAKAGLCSRRDAETWINDGRVVLNGKKLTTPAVVVSPGDLVTVDGVPLPAHGPPELWRYHKPKGRVTTHRDPEGRPTVFDAMPDDMPRVISIGRLDFNTEGLLLLTTDGDLARHLELPATGWLRRYRVRAHGDVTADALAKLADGVTVDGIAYGPVDAKIDSKQGGNTWLSVALREGKNREVRNIMAHLGLVVNRLIRVSYGPFQLQDLAIGQVEHVRRKVLADQLGPALAQSFGLRDADPAATRKAQHRRRGKPTTQGPSST